MLIKSYKVTGDGSVHTFASIVGADNAQCKWASIASSSASLLVGGSEVTSSVGFPVGIGFNQFLPAISEVSNFYHLALMKYYAANAEVFYLLLGMD
jgi:hypothetical protein